MCVVDADGSWLSEWHGRFEALDIARLRSPVWAHPDMADESALLAYAWRTGRQSEIYSATSAAAAPARTFSGLWEQAVGAFDVPGAGLFADFCRDTAAQLPHTMLPGVVAGIRRLSSDFTYTTPTSSHAASHNGSSTHAPTAHAHALFELDVVRGAGPAAPEAPEAAGCACPTTSATTRVRARFVVLAMGAGGKPLIPRPFLAPTNSQRLSTAAAPSAAHDGTLVPRAQLARLVVHTSEWQRLGGVLRPQLAAQIRGGTVLVVGGGLSAAQAAVLAAQQGAARVVLCSRRPLLVREFDIPRTWIDRRKIGRGLFDFYTTPIAERRRMIADIRGGGSLPAFYMDQLRTLQNAGLLEMVVDEVVTAELEAGLGASGNTLRITFKGHGGAAVLPGVSCVLLGTGTASDCTTNPLCAHLNQQHGLPVQDGLPVLQDDMQWGHDAPLFVCGSLAALQIGPDAGNMSGARRAALQCAHAIMSAHSRDRSSRSSASASSRSKSQAGRARARGRRGRRDFDPAINVDVRDENIGDEEEGEKPRTPNCKNRDGNGRAALNNNPFGLLHMLGDE